MVSEGGVPEKDKKASQPQPRSWNQPKKSTPLWALNVVYFVHEGARMLLLRFMTAYFTRVLGDTPSGIQDIGLLQALGTMMSFFGELTWASVNDTRYDFRHTVLMCNTVGICLFMCIPLVGQNVPIMALLYGLSSFGLSWVGIRDAYAVGMLEKISSSPLEGAQKFGKVRKFAALGWGASGMVTGIVSDHFGPNGIFVFFFVLQMILMLSLLCLFQPEGGGGEGEDDNDEGEVEQQSMAPQASAKQADKIAGSMAETLRQPFVLLFFSNVLFYGVCTSLQEVYEFVYLLKGFQGTTNTLLGITLTVMTLSELPVFHFADKLIQAGFMSVYSACQIMMSVRCVLYAALPSDKPWMVLLIEPFHGATFAAMWAASVEFGRRVAPKGCRSRMQALVSGTYFQVSQGIGALLWGVIIQEIDFRPSYRACAAALAIWCVVWNLMVRCQGPTMLHSDTTSIQCGEGIGQVTAKSWRRLSTASFYRRMAPMGGRVMQGEPDTPYTPFIAKKGASGPRPGKPWG